MKTNKQATGSNSQDRALSRRGFLANTVLIGAGLAFGPSLWASSADQPKEINKMKTRKLGKLEVSMTYPSVAASAEVAVYASWAEILMRMTPWTVVQNKIHPAVGEAAFTPLDMCYLSR